MNIIERSFNSCSMKRVHFVLFNGGGGDFVLMPTAMLHECEGK